MFYGAEAAPHLNVTAFNLSYWYNPDYNTILDKAIGETVTDPAASQQDYITAMNMLVDQAPAVFLYDVQTPYVIPSHIAGFQYNLNYPFTAYFYYQLTPAQ
jgi:peptide/nickel transport system substrate-binding protein